MDNSYWTLVSSQHDNTLKTYEHRLPHGALVLVRTDLMTDNWGAVAFVPAAPPPGSERP